MRKEQPREKLEVECPPDGIGHVIGQLVRIGSWITEQRNVGERIVIAADVPEDAIPGFVEWLGSFEPPQGATVKRGPANDEDA